MFSRSKELDTFFAGATNGGSARAQMVRAGRQDGAGAPSTPIGRDRALPLLLADLERRKLAKVVRPKQPTRAKTSSRHVPADVRREVWSRDGGQCVFVGANGRCVEIGFLEFHHVIPFADGGPTTADNLQLRCRAHNAYEANEYFGSPLLRERSISYGLGLDRVTRSSRPCAADSLIPGRQSSCARTVLG